MKYKLHIPGEPVSKARPRVIKGSFAYTPARTKNYETFVRELFFAKHGQVMMNGAIKAEIVAYFPIPKSIAKELRALMAMEQYPHTSHIAYLDVKKRYSERPRVTLILAKIEIGIQRNKRKYLKRGGDCEFTEDCMWGSDGWCDRPGRYKCVLQETDEKKR